MNRREFIKTITGVFVVATGMPLLQAEPEVDYPIKDIVTDRDKWWAYTTPDNGYMPTKAVVLARDGKTYTLREYKDKFGKWSFDYDET